MGKIYNCMVIVFLGLITVTGLKAQSADEQSIDQKIIDATQWEFINLEMLLQGVGRFSFENTGFNGGRTFEVGVARIGLNGVLDDDFDYRIQLGFTNTPVLLDAYLGYKFSEMFRFRLGSQKPLTSIEQIPSPGDTDFIDRARLVGTVYKSREIGISFFGDINDFNYNVGIFNGSGVQLNNDNNFFLRGRIAYNYDLDEKHSVTAGLNGAYSRSRNETLGNTSIILDGDRYSIGGDIIYDASQWFVKGEILYTEFNVQFTAGTPSVLASYITLGYRPETDLELLIRWDRLGSDVPDTIPDNSLLIFGVNKQMTRLMSFQANLLTQFDDRFTGEQVGISFNLQFQL